MIIRTKNGELLQVKEAQKIGENELYALAFGSDVPADEQRQARRLWEELQAEKWKEGRQEEARKHCAEIAKLLDDIAEGRLYYCEKCGEFFIPGTVETDEYGEFVRHDCGEEMEYPATIADYIGKESLDYTIIYDSLHNFVAVRVYITLGGPTVWIDTEARQVVYKWGSDEGRAGISNKVCDYINFLYETE